MEFVIQPLEVGLDMTLLDVIKNTNCIVNDIEQCGCVHNTVAGCNCTPAGS